MKKETLGLIQIIIASLLFGLIPVIVRFDKNLNSQTLSFFRVFVAALCLALFFVFFRKIKLKNFKHERVKLIIFAAVHAFIILAYFAAIKFLPIAAAVLLIYSSAIWVVVFSYFILKEKITKTTLIALIISIIGLILVVSPKNLTAFNNLFGAILGILSGMGVGLVYVMSKTFKKYDKVSLTFWQNLIAIPFILPLFLTNLPKTFSGIDVLVVFLLGSLFTAIPFILIFKGFEKAPTQKGGILILLEIIFPIIIAFLLFQEIPDIWTIIGGVLIIIGSVIVNIKNK